MTRVFVVVSGPPGSGKSTIAPPLASALALPLVAKDTIKDALMAVLPVPDVAASRVIGRASVVAMLAVAAASPIGAVVESNFYRSRARDELQRLPGALVEVFCRCDPETAALRYRARAGSRAGWALRQCPLARRALERRGVEAGRGRLAGHRGRHDVARRHRHPFPTDRRALRWKSTGPRLTSLAPCATAGQKPVESYCICMMRNAARRRRVAAPGRRRRP